VPVLAFGLYLVTGTPGMPSAPYAERREAMERAHAEAQDAEALLTQLRARLAQMDPRSDQARQGWMLLGNAERSRGNLDAAAEAYTKVLAARFDADAAAQLAQVLLEADRTEEAAQLLARALPQAPQHIGLRFLSGLAEERAGRPERAKAIWRALAADAPEGAPWKAMVERRLNALP
jgi:cytochrome c-type biogenesis protein CcmH